MIRTMSIRIILTALISVMFLSCKSLDLENANAWLAAKKGSTSDLNITGRWDAGNYIAGGWGVGHFIQSGDKFHGTLSQFNVKGTIENRTIYMIIWGGKAVYTARLEEQPDGSFLGRAVFKGIVDVEDSGTSEVYLLSMKRMNSAPEPVQEEKPEQVEE